MDIENLENEQTFDILQYVKENLFGLFLLALAFLIIYFVDYINRLNTIINPTPTIPGIQSIVASPQKILKRKFKKR